MGAFDALEVGLFQIFDHVKTIKKPLKLPFHKKKNNF